MIIIFGNGPKYFVEAEGKFICPNCNFIKKYLTNSYSIKLDYLELRDEKNLSKTIKNNKFRLFIAYHINNVRLIDNY